MSASRECPKCLHNFPVSTRSCDVCQWEDPAMAPTTPLLLVENLSGRVNESNLRAAFGGPHAVEFLSESSALLRFDAPVLAAAVLNRDGKKLAGQAISVKLITPEAATLHKVLQLHHNPAAQTLAKTHGLAICRVTWEDCARSKQSVWGPCISDMTLVTQGGKALPVIRFPNYEDITRDVKLKSVMVRVGNEQPTPAAGEVSRTTITLYDYLKNFKQYLSKPHAKQVESLLKDDEESHAILSTQCCFLPVDSKPGASATFNVKLYNYQSRKGDPAVLALVVSADGTSAQVVECDGHEGQTLYHNRQGQHASFVAQRLSEDRKRRGVALDGPMSQQEAEQNLLMIIQVPLEQKPPHAQSSKHVHEISAVQFGGLGGFGGGGGGMFGGGDGGFNFGAAVPECAAMAEEEEECALSSAPDFAFGEIPREKGGRDRGGAKAKVDVEHAILRVGEAEGPFLECNGMALKRDKRYPIRITLQYYKTTSNGLVDLKVMSEIHQQLLKWGKGSELPDDAILGLAPTKGPARAGPLAAAVGVDQNGVENLGSLVTEPDSERPTESSKKKRKAEAAKLD